MGEVQPWPREMQELLDELDMMFDKAVDDDDDDVIESYAQ